MNTLLIALLTLGSPSPSQSPAARPSTPSMALAVGIERADRLRLLKHDRMQADADEARVDAVRARLEGAALVVGSVAVPAGTIASAVGVAAVAKEAQVPSTLAAPAVFALAAAGLLSTCIGLPIALSAGITRLGDAADISDEADVRQARLRAFDDGAMTW